MLFLSLLDCFAMALFTLCYINRDKRKSHYLCGLDFGLAFPEHSISYLFFNKRMTKTFILKITPAVMVHCKGHICQLFLLMQLECMGLFATQQ